MRELSDLTVEAMDLIISSDDGIKNIYITGTFSSNPLFLRLISDAYPVKNIYTSEVLYATALGAALVILDSLDSTKKPVLNLGLNRC